MHIILPVHVVKENSQIICDNSGCCGPNVVAVHVHGKSQFLVQWNPDLDHSLLFSSPTIDLNIGNLDSGIVKEPEGSNAQGEHLDSAGAIMSTPRFSLYFWWLVYLDMYVHINGERMDDAVEHYHFNTPPRLRRQLRSDRLADNNSKRKNLYSSRDGTSASVYVYTQQEWTQLQVFLLQLWMNF